MTFEHIKPRIRLLFALITATVALVGNAIAQTSASPYTTGYRYDSASRLVGTILPDPDGAGSIRHAATRNTYNSRGLLERVEYGELSTWLAENVPPSSWTGYTVFRRIDHTYDTWGRKSTESVTSAGVVIALTQHSYDAAGRLECTAQRMNPAAYGSLPTSACSLGPEGSNGPDRIIRRVYDTTHWDLLRQIRHGVGSVDEINFATYTYTNNRLKESVTDANGNRSQYAYDGLARLSHWYFPSKTAVGQYNPSDFEQYGYDSNGNRTSLRKRDGRIISYEYDNLNRVRVDVYPAGTIPNTYYGYDLRNLQLYSRQGSHSGVGISTSYDGFGRATSATTSQSGMLLTLGYEYDLEGNRTRLTHPDGSFFVYGYDGLNRLISISENGSSVPLIAQTYSARGAARTFRAGKLHGYSWCNDYEFRFRWNRAS